MDDNYRIFVPLGTVVIGGFFLALFLSNSSLEQCGTIMEGIGITAIILVGIGILYGIGYFIGLVFDMKKELEEQ